MLNVQIFCTNVRFGSFYYVRLTRKSCQNATFVQKICTFNVDEIDGRSSWKKRDRKNGYQDDIFRGLKQNKKFELTNVETLILIGHLLIWQGQMVRDKWSFQRGGWGKGLIMFIRLRVDLNNILRAAFTHKDPRSAEKTDKLSVFFCAFGISTHKSSS